MDLIPVASQRSAAGLVTSAIAALAGILFFLIAPVVILVQTIRQRRARKIDSGNVISTSKARRYQTVLSLLGTVLVLNNLGALGSFMANNYRSFSTMVPHIALNYVIVALAIPVAALLVYSLVSKQEQKISKLRTIIAGATIALLGVFTATLISWNFFTLFI
ncbi:MAG: hypothetical protein FWC86_04925, partial [Coriobacteriia bacterium]|nr:hypothetical protein [Coriobacteriia bacterium]